MAVDASQLLDRRLDNWRQTPERRIQGPDEATALIDAAWIVTHFPVSPELPNLYHAFMGDPAAVTDSGHDSPSGEVYTWRWTLGRAGAGFYTAIARGRPTWVSWPLLPAVLRVRGELRTPEELYDAGALSAEALRIAHVLEEAGGILKTGELRARAGFPTGKEWRAAYLRAVQELDTRLLLAKVFAADDLDMRHSLVTLQHPDAVGTAEAMHVDAAFEAILRAYLPMAVYAVPAVLARHLGVSSPDVRATLERLTETGEVMPVTLPGVKEGCYEWKGAPTRPAGH